jgi:hypothetical protein
MSVPTAPRRLTVVAVAGLIAAWCVLGVFPLEFASAGVKPRGGQYKGSTRQDLPVQFQVKSGTVKALYYKIRFGHGCGTFWFPSKPSLGHTEGYGPFKVHKDGTFRERGSTGNVLIKGEFVTRTKVKGKVTGGLGEGNPPRCQGFKTVRFKAHRL